MLGQFIGSPSEKLGKNQIWQSQVLVKQEVSLEKLTNESLGLM